MFKKNKNNSSSNEFVTMEILKIIFIITVIKQN